MREDNIETYFNATESYLLFLASIVFDDEKYKKCILDYGDKYINVAKMGFISNIFLAIKEIMLEKKDNIFNILILESEFENNLNLIAKKCDNGYKIDNYIFQDKETLVNELRNKIAHGNFKFDLNYKKIILDINSNEVKININKLSDFVVISMSSCLKNYKTNNYTRKLTYNKLLDTSRTKPITNKSELISFIKKFKRMTINIKSKDKNIIPSYILKDFERAIKIFRETADEKGLYENLQIIKTHYNNKYELMCQSNSFKNIDYNTFATYILNSTRDDITYLEQAEIIGRELERYETVYDSKLNLTIESLHNIMILDIIKKYNTTNLLNIGKEIEKQYGERIMISSYTLVSSLITCFNALFSYGKDNIYKNRNKYTIEENDGLDYSKLDLSLFNIEVCNIDTGYIDDLKIRKIAKKNNIDKIEEQINKINDSLDKVKDINVIKTLKENIINLNNKKIELNNEYNVIDTEYNNANNYYINNIEYLKNERIIDGIRNSIAHGNYYVKNGENMLNNIIVFEDIYEDKLTFKCTINITDFIECIDTNSKYIINFIDNNKTKKLNK